MFNCATRIYKAIEDYQNNIIHPKFMHYCNINNCNKRISIPTKLFMSLLNELNPNEIVNKELYYQIQGTLNYLRSFDMSGWISYFDGIKLPVISKI